MICYHEEDFILVYNPVNKNKWFSIDFREGVFCIFNYFTCEYTVEFRYKKGS